MLLLHCYISTVLLHQHCPVLLSLQWLLVSVAALYRRLRERRPVYQQSFVVRQGSQLEFQVLPHFVEDRTPQTDGYADYLLRVHKAVLAGK